MKTKLLTLGTTLNGTRPIIRWAGGKRLILPKLRNFLPKTYGTYFEPMLGSGALFFSLCPGRAVLGDVNPELINFYRVIKTKPTAFYKAISKLRATKATYFNLRHTCPPDSLKRAVRFFYLIRLSWNGLYRVNQAGKFNVPFGGRKPTQLVTFEATLAASRWLKCVNLLCDDFEKTTAEAKKGDFIYLDPPYPKGAADKNWFDRYHKIRFTLDEHKRLSKYARELSDKGAFVLITEAATKEIIALYSSHFKVQLVESTSLIAADSKKRGIANEAIITNYDPVGTLSNQ